MKIQLNRICDYSILHYTNRRQVLTKTISRFMAILRKKLFHLAPSKKEMFNFLLSCVELSFYVRSLTHKVFLTHTKKCISSLHLHSPPSLIFASSTPFSLTFLSCCSCHLITGTLITFVSFVPVEKIATHTHFF